MIQFGKVEAVVVVEIGDEGSQNAGEGSNCSS